MRKPPCTPAIASGDPEVSWRLADVLNADGRFAEAESAAGGCAIRVRAASGQAPVGIRRSWRGVLRWAAEMMLREPSELARINVANRPTLRALKQAQATALASGDIHVAAEPRMQASGGKPPRSPDPRR